MKKVIQNRVILEKRVGESVITNNPRVSIVIPAYNVAGYIAETIDSALSQTFENNEIIVVNDGSPDTLELESELLPYFDKIIYIKQENNGAASARNTAIENARGEFIAFLDGDDVWLPEKLAFQINSLDNSNYEMTYCNAEFFGEKLYNFASFMEQSPSNGAVTTESLITGDCNVITSGTILEKKILDKFGNFDLDADRIEDFELWFRLAKNGVKIGYQKELLLKYRVGMSGLSGDNIKRAERNLKSLEIISKRNELNASEKDVWQKRLESFQAHYNLEKGKTSLVEGNYAEARENFRKANKHYRKLRFSIINAVLRVSPKLSIALFKLFRPTEFSHISSAKQKI